MFEALKVINWRAKAAKLVSEEGLQDLLKPKGAKEYGKPAAVVFLASSILFSSTVAFLYICGAERNVTAALSLIVFFAAFLAGLIYIFLIQQKQTVMVAVKELAVAFGEDIRAVLKSNVSLSSLEKEARVLVVVDAVGVLKNLLIQTYNTDSVQIQVQLNRVYNSLDELLKETHLSLVEIAKESKKTLSKLNTDANVDYAKQLQHVDMIFRFYLPLYSLLKQTDNADAVQGEIKKLLMDE